MNEPDFLALAGLLLRYAGVVMIDYLWFWVAKYLVELILCIGAIVSILLMAAVQALRQSRCPHDTGVNETQACDAICRKCGANLGFIGAWRRGRQDAKQEQA